MTQHTPQTLGEAWAILDRHGITHPDRPLDQSTFSVARAIIKIEAQRNDLLEALKQIREVDPDLGKMNRLAKIDKIAMDAIAKATE